MAGALINGIDVYYEVTGGGPPLLFINGSGSTLDGVRPLIGPFDPAFQVAVADSRGVGRTSVPDAAYAMADLASDAIGLADHLGWHTFNLIGVSFGGMVAQEVAVTAPERIQRLVLMCTSSGGMGGSSYPLHELAQLEPEQQAGLSAQVKDTRFTPEWLMAGPPPSPTRSFAPPSPVGPLSRGRSSRPVPAAPVARIRKGPATS